MRLRSRIAPLLIAAALFFLRVSFAQTAVDTLSRELDSLALVSLDTWKVSEDLKGLRLSADPTQANFDDSRWNLLRINDKIYPDSCWIRKEFSLPTNVLGQKVQGRIRFLVSVDDYGYLWVNGKSYGYFPWDGDFDITAAVKPGERVVVAIKAINTGGPLRLLRARLAIESVEQAQQIVQDLGLSLHVGEKLLSFDTYQTSSRQRIDPGIDKSTIDPEERKRLAALLQHIARGISVSSLGSGDINGFKSSVEALRLQLNPIREFAKRFTLYFDANAHIDAAWLWRSKETVEVCKNTFSSVINMMNQRPDFTYTQSAAAYYDWMQRYYPSLFDQIKQRVSDGRWEVVGGMWVEPDCNLPSGESWARHLLYSNRYFAKNLGAKVTIGWNPDSFGYNLNMPEFYRNAGIDAFITQKIGWNETNVFPYRLFWWQSPDGSRILSYFPFDYVNTIDDPFALVDWLRQYEANTGFRKLMILFGVGDHGGGPSLEMLQRIDRLASLDIFPSIEYGTAAGYLSWIRSQDLSRLPVWTDELYLEYHQGTYTTQAAMKRFNRSNEVLLTNAERLSSVAGMFGRPYNSTMLETAWRGLLFNQFHDILPGSGIREVYIDASAQHQDVQAIGNHETNRSLEYIGARVNTARLPKGTPVLVFNSLAWERRDLVRVDLPSGDEAGYAVFDQTEKELPSQIIHEGRYKRTLLFIADKIPPMGYASFVLRRQPATSLSTALKSSPWSLENDLFRIEVDSTTGWIRGIHDKSFNREILNGAGNQLQLLEDHPKAWDAWNVGLTGTVFPTKFRSAEVVEQGPVRAVIRLTRDYLTAGVKKDFPTEDFPSTFFTQDIILYNGLDRIDFTTDVDWWEDRTMLKVAFPLAVTDTIATYEIPFGTIRRSTQMRNSWERARVEVPAARWADVSSPEYGVSLLNNSKYGYDIKGNVMRLSLLRSPKWPDPTADRGKHSIQYALYPHAHTWKEAATVHRGYEFNYPLLATTGSTHRGDLPASRSFVKVSPANLVLTTFKKAEDSDAWIVQWYESAGENTAAVIELPRKPRQVFRSDFLETDGVAIPFTTNILIVTTGASSVVTLKVVF